MKNERWYISYIDEFGDIKNQTNLYTSEKEAEDGLKYLKKIGEDEGKFVSKR